jgi:hypothetical protein
MLRCTFALELRRVLRMTHPTHIVHAAPFAHYTAIKRGRDFAARIGFTEANKGPRGNRSAGLTAQMYAMREGRIVVTKAQASGRSE